jgi:hypothetical protein
MSGKEQENQDLQNLINAVRIAQSKGAYKLEQSEILSGNVRKVSQFIQQNK